MLFSHHVGCVCGQTLPIAMTNSFFRRPLPATLVALALIASACSGSTSNAEPVSTTTTSGPPITAEPLPEIDPAPSAPVGVVVVQSGDGAIELGWDVSRDETVTGYEITRVSPSGNTERFEVGVPSYLDRGLEDGTIFTYQVRAVGSGGLSDGSEAVTAQVGVDSNPPRTPGRPTITETATGVELAWGPVSDISGIDRYIITRTLDGEVSEIDAGTDTFYVDEIDPGLVVTYSVRAVDSARNESGPSRNSTVLSGVSANGVVVVVSAQADPANDPSTARLERELLDEGYALTWFEDGVFDANVTTSDDVVLLLGDVLGEGFDWNIFATDATVIGLKSMFVEASGITENPPKLDRLAQLDYLAPGTEEREVALTTTSRPKPVVYIPANEQLPSLESWARPVWSDEISVAGLIPQGGELANERPAPGCRAFFPGNSSSLEESTDAGWELLLEFVEDVRSSCQ